MLMLGRISTCKQQLENSSKEPTGLGEIALKIIFKNEILLCSEVKNK